MEASLILRFELMNTQCVYGKRLEAVEIPKNPVFILGDCFARPLCSAHVLSGHPRTGTTHLHNILALDPRFVAPTTLQVRRS